MTDLPAATRARLDDIRERLPGAYGLWREDLDTLLTIIAALRAAQARSCEVCHTVSWAPTPDGEHCAHCDLVTVLRATAAACAQAEQAQAQAAPVLAAMPAWYQHNTGHAACPPCQALRAAWRATREG